MVCTLVNLHESFVNSEGTVQGFYIKVSVLKNLESFQGKAGGVVLF